MKISIGSDHGGFNLKEKIKAEFKNEYELNKNMPDFFVNHLIL